MALSVLLLLGLVQGLTEFLPVSSSGHLVLLEAVCGLKDPEANLTLNVFLHFASVCAVMVFYRHELVELLVARRRLLWPLFLGTLPAGVIGLLFHHQIEALFSNITAVALGWIGTGAALYWGQRRAAMDRDMDGMTPWRALGVGFAQAAAIMPGLSRSGMTISAALLAGLKSDDAMRFSFFLAIPVILGASVLELPKLLRAPGGVGLSAPVVGAGVLCFAVSYGALVLLVRLLRARRLHHFAYYVWALAVGVLVWQAWS